MIVFQPYARVGKKCGVLRQQEGAVDPGTDDGPGGLSIKLGIIETTQTESKYSRTSIIRANDRLPLAA
jgi:hypothetical protein